MNTLFVWGQLKVILKSTASYFCVTELKPGPHCVRICLHLNRARTF